MHRIAAVEWTQSHISANRVNVRTDVELILTPKRGQRLKVIGILGLYGLEKGMEEDRNER